VTPAVAIAPLPPTAAAVAAEIHGRSIVPPWPVEALGGLLAQPGVFGLLALVGETPMGFILCRVAADEAEVLTIAVLPESRRRGLARALLAEARHRAAAQGAMRLLLEVSVQNAPALALYRGAGFAEVGRRRGYYAESGGKSVDAAILGADLTLHRTDNPASNG